MLKRAVIKINDIKNIYEFQKRASSVAGEVILSKGKYVVDAKSILGIFSIDTSTDVTIIYPSDDSAFDNFVQQFVIE